jgi:hypothetical protein
VLILQSVKVLYFDTLLQVFILKELRAGWCLVVSQHQVVALRLAMCLGERRAGQAPAPTRDEEPTLRPDLVSPEFYLEVLYHRGDLEVKEKLILAIGELPGCNKGGPRFTPITTATCRTRPWLASGLECQGRRLSRRSLLIAT